ncbi:MAG: right-handed parallel beta-helix repeat-containing protein [Candidatus Thorarchaeota archaeon]
MHAKNRVVLFTMSIAIILVLSSGTQVLSPTEPVEQQSLVLPFQPERGGMTVSGTPHAPIIIDGDINFTATALSESWPGDGTSGDPFIIEGLDIDLGGGPGHGINISNTLVHFVIRNCNLTGANVFPGSGIYLYNVTNGIIINNDSTNNSYGIYFEFSDYNTVANNTCTSNIYGIALEWSNSTTVINNNCSGNSNSGIYLHITQAITVSDNTCSSNTYGIWLSLSNFDTVSDNTITSNSDSGINLPGSDFNTIRNNNCTDSNYGIYLDDSDSNTIASNIFASSFSYGIYHDFSSLNDYRWNVIIDNFLEISYLGSGDIFVNNYWESYSGPDGNHDGFGDTPYNFVGNSDPAPLVYIPTSPVWTQSPVDQTVEFGSFFITHDLNATAHSPISWDLDDPLFNVDNEGVVTSRIILPVGVYTIEVVVTTIYGFDLTGSFRVFIQDTISPHWLIAPSDLVLQLGDGLDYQLLVADLSGVDHWTLNDTSHFTLTSTLYHEGSTARIVNAMPLDPGVYGLTVTVYDPHGNTLSAAFSVIVETDTSIVTGGIDPVMTLALGGGMGGGAVIVIVIVVLRRKS